MIIVSGIPFSGTSIMLDKLKKGGLEIIPDLKASNAISGDNTKAAFIPSLELKALKGDHHIIFMNRPLKECFFCMKKQLGHEPHKSAFEIHLKDIRKYLKLKIFYLIDFNKLTTSPEKEMEKIKHLIPYFKKATKTSFFR